MKQNAGVESTQENINSLIVAIQNAATGLDRSRNLLRLWKIVEVTIMDLMVGKSYRINSDFDMRGYSIKERQRNLAGDAYLAFFMATMDFDRGLGVPFLAYIAQKVCWKLAADKRDNAKRDNRIKISSKMQANASEEFAEEDAFAALLERRYNRWITLAALGGSALLALVLVPVANNFALHRLKQSSTLFAVAVEGLYISSLSSKTSCIF